MLVDVVDICKRNRRNQVSRTASEAGVRAQGTDLMPATFIGLGKSSSW